jgi:hypothetical protein
MASPLNFPSVPKHFQSRRETDGAMDEMSACQQSVLHQRAGTIGLIPCNGIRNASEAVGGRALHIT